MFGWINVDVAMMFVTFAFSYSLIPQIVKVAKEKRNNLSWQTLSISSVGLVVLTICFFKLGLIFNAYATMITDICWWVLLLQKISLWRNK